jgi:hypothetical protein
VTFPRLAALATKAWFRGLVAAALLALHVLCLTRLAEERLGVGFNTAPGNPPEMVDPSVPMTAGVPPRWNRLVVSRWDAQHYMGIAMRGFSQCPPQDMRTQDLAAVMYKCDFSFYPGYALLARFATFGGRVAIDYAMFGVSLAAAWTLLFLLTGPTFTRPLGLGTTYLALLLYSVYPESFTLVTLHTEACVVALAMGAFVALSKRRYLAGALLAGAATGMRISGAAVGAGFGLALVATLVTDRPRSPGAWAMRASAAIASVWGLALMMGWYWHQYQDPLLYVHSHASAYKHMSSADMFPTGHDFWLRALDNPRLEVVWIAACFLALALGCRRALAGFDGPQKTYLYGLAVLGTGISLAGSWNLGFLGMNRYWLLVLPVFFSLAVILRRHKLALALWIGVCAWFYWNVEACDYVAQYDAARICKFQ